MGCPGARGRRPGGCLPAGRPCLASPRRQGPGPCETRGRAPCHASAAGASVRSGRVGAGWARPREGGIAPVHLAAGGVASRHAGGRALPRLARLRGPVSAPEPGSSFLSFCEVPLMPRALALAMTILVGPLGRAAAVPPPDAGANAALTYWQAFATLPTLSPAEQNKLNTECLSMPLDARARELLDRADYALRMMGRAAAVRRCDWGITWEDGIYVRLPQAPAART